MRTTRFLRITLQFLQTFLTDARTFMVTLIMLIILQYSLTDNPSSREARAF